jgi:hypothetical protein
MQYDEPAEKIATYSSGTLDHDSINDKFHDYDWCVDKTGKVVVWHEDERGAMWIQDLNPRKLKIHHGKGSLKGKHFLNFDGVVLDETKFCSLDSTPKELSPIFKTKDSLGKKKSKFSWQTMANPLLL